MTDQNSPGIDPNHQNSFVERQVRPTELMEELGIKKDAYYTYLKQLGIKAQKDGDGQAYLTPEQADRIRQLRSHVLATGKLEGFEQSTLATAPDAGLGEAPPWEADAPPPPTDFERLIQQAQELAAHNLAMGDLVVAQIAQQMSYEDLSPELQQKVAQVREATRPKANPAHIASQVLNRWRNQRGTAAA